MTGVMAEAVDHMADWDRIQDFRAVPAAPHHQRDFPGAPPQKVLGKVVVASAWASLAFAEASLLVLEEEVVVVPLLQKDFPGVPPQVMMVEVVVVASAWASLAF